MSYGRGVVFSVHDRRLWVHLIVRGFVILLLPLRLPDGVKRATVNAWRRTRTPIPAGVPRGRFFRWRGVL